MNPAQSRRETQLFVVHVWRQRACFRASVRHVDREETQVFNTPSQLARYLAAASGERWREAVAQDQPADVPTPSSQPRRTA